MGTPPRLLFWQWDTKKLKRYFMEPTDYDFSLFKLLNGGKRGGPPLCVGQIPARVTDALKWNARKVFLTYRDSQKIRHHQMHGMDASKGLALPMVVRNGDYYQSMKRGSEFQIEVILHEPDPKRAYFLVLARDAQDKGIFVRTFYFNKSITRSKMKLAQRLFIQSDHEYFKK
ncbi:hypothetical protein [Citreimonas sp.]|uniref:hypothetical protein n=1 Tax=Citreimonas sp. TaxID=3036715 RepID=UPI0035C79C25